MAELTPREKKKWRFEKERLRKVGVAALQPRRLGKDGLDFHRTRYRRDFTEARKRIILAVQILGVMILAFLVVEGFFVRVRMSGESMEPAIVSEGSVLMNRVIIKLKAPKRGDIVAFYPSGNKRAKLSIKRVIGVPGDVVLIKNGAVYINGEALSDVQTDSIISESGRAATDISLKKGEYFVLGDNRANSEDSRYETVGNVRREDMAGKCWLSVSRHRFGFLN